MRLTPKMTVNPLATRKSEEALARPLSAWRTRLSKGARSALRAERAHHLVRGQVVLAVRIVPVGHGALAVLQHGATDEGTHGGLVIEGAELDGAEDGAEFEARHGIHHRLRLDRRGLLQHGSDRH